MKSKAFLLTVLLAAGFTATVLYLFGVQFSSGDVYPEYSSLRTDAQGAKLLLDSLVRIPGLSVERSFLPLEFLQEDRATVLLLGLNPESFAKDPDPYLQSIQKLAARGNRIVAALEMDSEAETPRAGALENMWHVRFGRDSKRKSSSSSLLRRSPGLEGAGIHRPQVVRHRAPLRQRKRGPVGGKRRLQQSVHGRRRPPEAGLRRHRSEYAHCLR